MADDNPIPGAVAHPEPGIRRILAANPSPMTHTGTNTYIIGEGRVAVIDPGPASPTHLRAILDGLAPGETVSHIFVTHAHHDHSSLAAPLAEATGAAIHAFGDARAGRSPVMATLAAAGLTGGGEGVHTGFQPDERLCDKDSVAAASWTLTALHTPGHFGNHLCFAYGDAVFTGDHIMGWASTMVSPPDGDLSAFMTSTARLAARRDRIFYPGHGAAVHDPAGRADWLLDHRRRREGEILARLDRSPRDIAALTRDIYTDIPGALLPAAARNVFAHLIDLHRKKMVTAEPHLAIDARFRKA